MNRLDRKGIIEFESSDKYLEDGFKWAKKQALSYAFEGDIVGDWYEAALPGRAAFCMRDVSHHSIGGQALGLISHNKNMLLKFAQGIAESRDFCSFWEIDKNYRPAPVDYKSDQDFWYNLPANFDVLDACWRVYLWTGDIDYIKSWDFDTFYDLSVTRYVDRWDPNGDGILERYGTGGRRGIPSYDEGIGLKDAIVMLDLISIQARGYLSYAAVCELRDMPDTAKKYREKALELCKIIRDKWWNKNSGCFFKAMLKDNTMVNNKDITVCSYPLYYNVVIDEEQLKTELSNLAGIDNIIVEGLSYLPGTFYRRGLNKDGYKWLKEMVRPNLKRREYPEVSFCTVGYYVEALMGIQPYAHLKTIETTPRLTSDTKWARLRAVPVFDGTIDVEHNEDGTIIENHTGETVTWKARFSGKYDHVNINGREMDASIEYGTNGQVFSYAQCEVSNFSRCIASPVAMAL